jgi:type IV pilus assembly protein PilC
MSSHRRLQAIFQRQPRSVSYQWIGLVNNGKSSRGIIQAPNRTTAKLLLHQQGIHVKKIRSLNQRYFSFFHTITSDYVVLFSRQMATLLHAQIPFIQAIETLQKSQKNHTINMLLNTIKHDVASGLSFSESLRKHPRYFNHLFCHLIDAGEQSGALSALMLKLAAYQENMLALRKKIKLALLYPCAILCITLLVTWGLMVFIIPQFEQLFHTFNAQLPSFTQTIITLSTYCQTYWLQGIGMIMFFCISCRGMYQHFYPVKTLVDHLLMSMPWFGNLLQQWTVARLTHTLFILLTAGLPLVDALNSVSNITQHRLYNKAILTIREDVIQGLAFHTAIEHTHYFPDMMIQMIAIGEESGRLESMLAHIATTYDDLIHHKTEQVNHLLEPVLLITLGLIVGTLIIAMYLPIFQLGAII